MTIINRFFIAILAVTSFAACENDGDLITLSGLKENELMATQSEVVLTQGKSDDLVLSLGWSANTLIVSNASMSAPNVLRVVLQISKMADFSSSIVEFQESSLSHAFSGSDLNTVAKSTGIVAEVATPLYFRLKSSVGDNIDAVYSNSVTVQVTSYEIDMSYGFILDKDMVASGGTLYSAASNGQYLGFMGATSWYNFYVKEGDGTTWGNDGISGTEFILSSSNEAGARWNCWFPGYGGCYYVDFNTNKKTWSALYIPSLAVSGDISGDMVFDRPNVKWTLPFTAKTTTLSLKIDGNGLLYDNSTGTNDASAINQSVAFNKSGDNVTFGSVSETITISVPSAGEYTLTIDLKNPSAWQIEAVEGTSEPVEISPFLYLTGVDDGISGSWTFDNYLKLYDEDQLSYAGVVNVNSLWGYTLNIEKDNWADKYTMASGDALSGELVFQGSDNIPAPTAGLYLIDASLKALSYQLNSVGTQIYVSGLNNIWDFNTVLAATATIGEYSGVVTINEASSYGFQIHLDSSWNHYFGGANGSLFYKGTNISDDAALAAGTYTLTVDLLKGTYLLVQ